MSSSSNTKENKPSLFSMVVSILAAFLGVQTEKNRQRDFQHGSAKAYIIIGIVLTAFFVLGLVAIANLAVGALA